MITNQDRSHATNVANFEALLAYCKTLGIRYNPSQNRMMITYMEGRFTETKELMRTLDSAIRVDIDARDRRREAFDALPSIASRVVGTFSFCNVTADSVKSAKSLLKKIQGKRITAPKDETQTETPATPSAPPASAAETAEPTNHEAAQRSFMFLVQHFSQLIESVTLATDYNPNELELKIPALETYLEELDAHNSETLDTGAALDKARFDRDRALYRDGDGLVKIAKEVKRYIAIAFGSESPQSVHANSIIFIDHKFKELDAVLTGPVS